ncbi:EthD family reductase [Paenibacillus sp. GCM10023250]|uniref:EthD family reductase n=1 Tax=Paenibacillus sp. GCM10023250 TaxID=3252648 RepID=UPI003622A73A
MAKLMVIYEKPLDVEGFEKHYFGVHMPLVKKLPKLIGASALRVASAQNTDEELYLVVEAEFGSTADLHAALASAEGQAVTADVANITPFLKRPPVILIAE